VAFNTRDDLFKNIDDIGPVMEGPAPYVLKFPTSASHEHCELTYGVGDHWTCKCWY
jgi:hypothetical protein